VDSSKRRGDGLLKEGKGMDHFFFPSPEPLFYFEKQLTSSVTYWCDSQVIVLCSRSMLLLVLGYWHRYCYCINLCGLKKLVLKESVALLGTFSPAINCLHADQF